MFDFLKQSILKRYSREQLAEIYGVKLPNSEELEEKIKNIKSNPVSANCYDIINKNKFVNSKGVKSEVRVDKDNNLVLITAKLSWLQKILLIINMFIGGIMSKIFGFFEDLITKITSKIPVELINFVSGFLKILMALVTVPLLILKTLMGIIMTIKNQMQSGGILGLVVGIILGILIFVVQIIVIVISALLSPLMEKIVDKMINKSCVKNMIIGHFILNNNYDGTIVVSPEMVKSISFETKKSLLGKEKLYVIIKENEDKVSFLDKIKSFFIPTYFVNRQTVIVTDVENKLFFENVFKI